MFTKDIGIDLGTANVLIYIKGQGIVLNEPSVVAIDSETKKPLAVGTEAREMLGRTPGRVQAIRPMKDGVIADFEITEIMLNSFIKKIKAKKLFSRPRILICCPTNITPVEKNAIKEAAERTGARKVYIEEEPKVAAIGAGMDISKPTANMVIDIGGGTTDIAILSLNDIVSSTSVRIAGNVFDQDIIKYIKEKYNKPGNVYLGLVHRLDRPVGGVMVFAKTSKAAARLSEQVREKIFKKTYLVVANGKMESEKRNS